MSAERPLPAWLTQAPSERSSIVRHGRPFESQIFVYADAPAAEAIAALLPWSTTRMSAPGQPDGVLCLASGWFTGRFWTTEELTLVNRMYTEGRIHGWAVNANPLGSRPVPHPDS